MTITIADGRGALWQWDTGRRLRVGSGVEQIHYQNRALGRSVDVDVGTDGTAIIPDELLQDCHTLTAYVYVTDDTGAYTMEQQDFIVHKRAKPAGYVYTPTEQMTLQTIQRQIGDLADLTTEAKENLVAAINEAAASGGAGSMALRVADGYIQYSTDSGSTWQNLIAVAELKGADGSKGEPGAPGKDGAGMDVTGATVGQIAKISAVDASGVPTAWSPVDMPSGGSSDLYVDFWPTGSGEEYNGNFNGYQVELATDQTFDAIFDSFNAGNKIVARLYKNADKSELGASSVDTAVTGSKEFGAIRFQFVTTDTDAVAGFEFIGEDITMMKMGEATVIFLIANQNVLPTPNADGTDNGKVPIINGIQWELKTLPPAAPVDTAMSDTSTNAVQNKAIKQYVDSRAAGSGAVRYDATQSLTFEQKQQARKNIEALPVAGAVTAGVVSMCPDFHIVDSNAAVHIVPSKVNDEDYTITLDCGPENWPVRVAGIRTPTDAQTNYAANVAYVKAKIAAIGAGAALPSVTAADNGKILRVVGGAWAAASLPVYNGGVS